MLLLVFKSDVVKKDVNKNAVNSGRVAILALFCWCYLSLVLPRGFSSEMQSQVSCGLLLLFSKNTA